MTELEILDAQTWTPQEAAAYVREPWQHAVGSIIETGERLVEAKERVAHGQWLPTVELLPFSESTARRLMEIARHPDLSNRAHVHDLPASWGTLAVLAQLPPGEIPKRIEAGEITPDLQRSTAEGWAGLYAAAQQEALNAYSKAVDDLTAALSWARTYEPPAEIPEHYVQRQEFKERIGALAAITEDWKDDDNDQDGDSATRTGADRQQPAHPDQRSDGAGDFRAGRDA